MDAAPTGIWLAVDVGTVRVGVARSDPRGVLAVPVRTLARDRRRGTDLAALADLVREYEAAGVVVGLPRTLRGEEGAAARAAREYGSALARLVAPVPVEYADERLTTVTAQRKLHQSGIRERAGRAVVDQLAAVEVLQHWLDTRRAVPHGATGLGHDEPQQQTAGPAGGNATGEADERANGAGPGETA